MRVPRKESETVEFKRVREECIDAGLPEPAFTETAEGFMVTLSATPQKTPQNGNLADRLAEVIAANPEATRKEIAGLLNISEHTVKEYVAKLKAEGRLTRVGSDRAGRWVIREPRARYRPRKSPTGQRVRKR